MRTLPFTHQQYDSLVEMLQDVRTAVQAGDYLQVLDDPYGRTVGYISASCRYSIGVVNLRSLPSDSELEKELRRLFATKEGRQSIAFGEWPVTPSAASLP